MERGRWEGQNFQPLKEVQLPEKEEEEEEEEEEMVQICRTHSMEHKCVHVISIDRTVLRCFTGIITDFRERNLPQVACECYKCERKVTLNNKFRD